jgi:hypothetical protein
MSIRRWQVARVVAAASAPKSLWVVEGAKHQDFLRYDPKGYEEHVVGFLNRNLDAVTPSPADER